MRLIAIAILMVAPGHATQAQENQARAYGKLSVELSSEAVQTTEEIRGRILLRVVEPADGPGDSSTLYGMNGPRARIEIDLAGVQATVLKATLQGPVPNPIRAGRTYEVPFRIGIDPELAQLVKDAETPLALFHPGTFSLRATIEGAGMHSMPRYPQNSEPIVAEIESDVVRGTIADGKGRHLSREDVLAVMENASPDLQVSLVRHYSRELVLGARDLIHVMGAVGAGKARGKMAVNYASLGHPLDDLPFFEPMPQRWVLHHEEGKFVFFAARPGQETTIENGSNEAHNLNGWYFNKLLAPKAISGGPSLPKEPGVYEFKCDVHGTPFGWVLVLPQ
ncbi:MAG: hypothetical protein O6952_03250 [Planctomycetota bacterium]|nr:hypothetical protein [Planctomycetota bacterium]